MDRSSHLILKNNIDVTNDVVFCQYNNTTKRYDVTFKNGTTYSCAYHTIEWICKPESVSPLDVRILLHGNELWGIQSIDVFHGKSTDYWHILWTSGIEQTYKREDLNITFSCLTEQTAKNRKAYLHQVASLNELRSERGDKLLARQYERLAFVRDDCAMAVYLNSDKHPPASRKYENLIFPFGCNKSQFKAVKNALENQISVIEGPPGTGKTQTILNILANLLVAEKNAQVVSNNNSATQNVLEKLASPKYNLDFLVAALGSSENKRIFLQSQSGIYPDISAWSLDAKSLINIEQQISNLTVSMSKIFDVQEQLALLRSKLDSLNLEIRYFRQYCDENNFSAFTEIQFKSLKPETLLNLWLECQRSSEQNRAVSFWFKIRCAFILRIKDWHFYKNSLSEIITCLQHLFYQAKQSELESQISSLESTLACVNAEAQMSELTSISMVYLRAKLFNRYGNRPTRRQFSEEDLWKRCSLVLEEYPITLSTTFSSLSSLKNVTYDYLIMDEASQVDLATGALALSSAKNAVIVGDMKQLSNIVPTSQKKHYDSIFNSFDLPQGFSFSENSFLKSVSSVIPNIPRTLLREHYRCHPKIIGFCNQKFYENELIIMTEGENAPDILSVFKTPAGNHRRDHINQRQIDVLLRDALPAFSDIAPSDIGVIAPYRDQVSAISSQISYPGVEIDTIHKFQGREKDAILFTTVDDVVTAFSDAPELLNVAISRAKRHFSLVVSGNDQPRDSNIHDLISYIEYNNFQITESCIYSVFDLLSQDYTQERILYLQKHHRISEYDSENLMYVTIKDVLKRYPQLALNVVCHHPLHMLIRNTDRMTAKECHYALNPATHLDFLIYSQISKEPVLAIEVDGFHYHKKGTKQYNRDQLKNHILELYEIPFMRFPTNGSGEKEKLDAFFNNLSANKFN